MRIDKAKFLERLNVLGLGTGTLATKAGVPPDLVQRLLATKEIEDGPEAESLLNILGPEILLPEEDVSEKEQPQEPQEPVAELSVKATLEKIDAGELTPQEVYEAEVARDKPRRTLLSYLEKEYGIGV